MSRSFRLAYNGRELEIRVGAIDEAWELWLFEKGDRLKLVEVVTIDEALIASRQRGVDRIAEVAGDIGRRLESGEIILPDESASKSSISRP
jgi:hypothetical protein